MNDFSKFIAEEINKGDKTDINIFDVGCFQGNFSRSLKEKLNQQAKYFLFDPNPNLALKDFDINRLAFSDIEGNQDYHLNNFFPASGSSLNKITKDDKLWNFTRKLVTGNIKKSFSSFSVKTNTLDNFCEENNIKKISVLKIDTEGSEMKVLNGGKNILQNTQIILVEILDTKKNFNQKYLDVNNLLESNYKFKNVKEKNIWSLGTLSNMKAIDALFIKSV
jgi:FkbM family methyltransferase